MLNDILKRIPKNKNAYGSGHAVTSIQQSLYECDVCNKEKNVYIFFRKEESSFFLCIPCMKELIKG